MKNLNDLRRLTWMVINGAIKYENIGDSYNFDVTIFEQPDAAIIQVRHLPTRNSRTFRFNKKYLLIQSTDENLLASIVENINELIKSIRLANEIKELSKNETHYKEKPQPRHNDAIDALQYAMPFIENMNLKGDFTMKNDSKVAITFEENKIKLESEAKIAEIRAQTERDIQAEKEAAEMEEIKAEISKKAYINWVFFSELLNNGFNEEQAMQILLKAIKD